MLVNAFIMLRGKCYALISKNLDCNHNRVDYRLCHYFSLTKQYRSAKSRYYTSLKIPPE